MAMSPHSRLVDRRWRASGPRYRTGVVGPFLVGAVLWGLIDGDHLAADDDAVASPTASTPTPADPTRDLVVRFARARLRLAELDLERALDINARAPAAIGGRQIDRLEHRVESLRRQVEVARDQPRTAARQVTVAAAEAARDVANVDLERARAANRRMPGAVSEVNLKRLEAALDLADVRVQMCRNPDYDLSLLAEMQWSIERLTEEVVDLRHRLDATSSPDFGR